jgi:hypothetical protein
MHYSCDGVYLFESNSLLHFTLVCIEFIYMLGGTVSSVCSRVLDGGDSFQMLSSAVNMPKSRGQSTRGILCLAGWTAGRYHPAAMTTAVVMRLTHEHGLRLCSNTCTYTQIISVVNILVGRETSGKITD